jgi:hypothetical protein
MKHTHHTGDPTNIHDGVGEKQVGLISQDKNGMVYQGQAHHGKVVDLNATNRVRRTSEAI